MFSASFLQKNRRHAAYAFFFCLVIIAILSLVPGQHRPHTAMTGRMEHAVAYAGTGLVMMFGFLTARPRARGYVSVVFLAFVFEVLQTWIPGRSSNILDALASSSGFTVGAAAGWLLTAQAPKRKAAAD